MISSHHSVIFEWAYQVRDVRYWPVKTVMTPLHHSQVLRRPEVESVHLPACIYPLKHRL